MFSFSLPKRVGKGWGHELWLANGPMYCAKLLVVEPGKRCSLHYHQQKFEMFYLLRGAVTLQLEDRADMLPPNVVAHVPPYTAHRFAAGPAGATLLEVSTQHREDDSVRLEKGD